MLSARIEEIVHSAIAQAIFPGAVVLVSQGGETLHHAAYGWLTYRDEESPAVTTETLYDIASLTKIVTATAALRLWEQGDLDLDAAAAHYLPELAAQDVRVRHLLTHTSGLDLQLSAAARSGRKALLRAIYAAPLRHPPGHVAAYTNINSLLLGEIVARLAGAPLEQAIGDLVLSPLGMRATHFRPPFDLLAQIAPTERDGGWRGMVHGDVHDESAYVLGGVAGHAGLFSTADDLLRFALAWAGRGGAELLRPETIAEATRNHTDALGLACGLGWMVDRPNFMGEAPQGSYGHTGFTGPALVIVPSERLVVIVLSNRTYPRRAAPAHHAITAALVGAALVRGGAGAVAPA